MLIDLISDAYILIYSYIKIHQCFYQRAHILFEKTKQNFWMNSTCQWSANRSRSVNNGGQSNKINGNLKEIHKTVMWKMTVVNAFQLLLSSDRRGDPICTQADDTINSVIRAQIPDGDCWAWWSTKKSKT